MNENKIAVFYAALLVMTDLAWLPLEFVSGRPSSMFLATY